MRTADMTTNGIPYPRSTQKEQKLRYVALACTEWIAAVAHTTHTVHQKAQHYILQRVSCCSHIKAAENKLNRKIARHFISPNISVLISIIASSSSFRWAEKSKRDLTTTTSEYFLFHFPLTSEKDVVCATVSEEATSQHSIKVQLTVWRALSCVE